MWRHMIEVGHQLRDRAVAVDQVVRAHPGQLAELDVGRVLGERVVGRLEAVGRGVVLDDHARPAQPEVVDPVVAAGVGAHLALALGAERDRLLAHARRRDRPGHRQHRAGVAR